MNVDTSWKLNPICLADCFANRSKPKDSKVKAQKCFDKSSSACSFETATLINNSKSFALFVLLIIFINSYFVSNENVLILYLK